MCTPIAGRRLAAGCAIGPDRKPQYTRRRPLLPVDEAPLPAERLNPVLDVEGVRVVMLTQFMAAVPASELRAVVSSLDREANAILAAIDFLHQRW